MNYRPYPRVARAHRQVQRGRVRESPPCPLCGHLVNRHACEDGQLVCTRGPRLITCRDCAELWARSPVVASFVELGIALRHGTKTHVLTEHPRRAGNSAITKVIVDQALEAGGHVHVAGRAGVRCAGGARHAGNLPPQHPAEPLVLSRVVRTCVAVPSQWDAWTVDGQYLYLRYRSGIGTVDAYDTEDSSAWTRIPDGSAARFDTGDRIDGEMDLVEFCERTGLKLADDAEVTGE